jgi:hypothetical protein
MKIHLTALLSHFSSFPQEYAQMHQNQSLKYVKAKDSYQTTPHGKSSRLVFMKETYLPNIFLVFIAFSYNSCASLTPLGCSFPFLSVYYLFFQQLHFLWGIWCGILACYATLLAQLFKILSTKITSIVNS